MDTCAVCDKELTKEDVRSIKVTDVMLTCIEHSRYGSYQLQEVAKMRVGLIKDYSDKLKKCAICNCDLTQDDVSSFRKDTVSPTCEKHRIAHDWLQVEISKDWFEYCDFVDFDLNYSKKNWDKFIQWRIKKYNK